jgi:CBS domain containing-hemolysin-like protein
MLPDDKENTDSEMTTEIIGLLLTMVFSAFFSGMEIAFVSSNRLRAEMDREKNGIAQRAIDLFYQHPNNFVSTMLVGNNISLVIYGILFAKIFDATLFTALADGARVTADTLLSTLVVLFTGEFLPKSIFKSNPNTMLTIFAVPAWICYVVLYPISRFATMLSKVLMRLVGVKMEKEAEDKEFTKVDLDYLVQSSIDNAKNEDEIEEEVRIFQNALDFSETKVRDCMVPRTEIDAVEDTCSIEQLKQMFVESGHSKIVVYHEDIDHIVGYVHSSEMFRLSEGLRDKGLEFRDISLTNEKNNVSQLSLLNSQLIRPITFVPETMSASKMMQTLLAQKKSLGVVVDEFGGTSGLISLEDIVEEIFGDIEDEHDSTNYVAKRMKDGDYLLSARLEIEKVNELFNLELPESDEYMTVGGLILHEYQSFPKLNEVVKIGQWEFKILKNTATKIELVRLKVIE